MVWEPMGTAAGLLSYIDILHFIRSATSGVSLLVKGKQGLKPVTDYQYIKVQILCL